MPDTIANNGTAVPDMSRAAAKAIYPNGGRNRTAARVQAHGMDAKNTLLP